MPANAIKKDIQGAKWCLNEKIYSKNKVLLLLFLERIVGNVECQEVYLEKADSPAITTYLLAHTLKAQQSRRSIPNNGVMSPIQLKNMRSR
jgi:hypothetical protein